MHPIDEYVIVSLEVDGENLRIGRQCSRDGACYEKRNKYTKESLTEDNAAWTREVLGVCKGDGKDRYWWREFNVALSISYKVLKDMTG